MSGNIPQPNMCIILTRTTKTQCQRAQQTRTNKLQHAENKGINVLSFYCYVYFVQHFNCYFHHKQHFVHSQQRTRRAVWESIKKKRLLFYLGCFYSFWFKELEMNVKFTHVFIQTMEVVFVFTQLLNVYNESSFCWWQSQILKDVPDPLWHNFNPTQNNFTKTQKTVTSWYLKNWKMERQSPFPRFLIFFLQGQWDASFLHNSPAHDPQPDLQGSSAATVTQNIHGRTKHRSLSNLNWKLLEGKMKQVTWLEVQRQVSTAQHGRND